MQMTLTVTELTFAIKKHLESNFPLVSVRGEISNLKEQSSGHFYFTLKDAESQISAVLFKGYAKSMTRLPKSGDQVIIEGELNVYAPRGNYQLLVKKVEYAGVGELLLKLHVLKAKLQERGWFDPKNKKSLPKQPRTIGVVTSPTGSVIQDILHILSRRFSGFHLILNPVKVQGEGAAFEIAQAIGQFNQYKLADVVIVARGGGSLEDLWPFNEEIVAAAIFASEIPIISAVGHETDFSLCDFVADVRAPTPSAAAEMVVQEKKHFEERLLQSKKRLGQTLFLLVREKQRSLSSLIKQPLFTASDHWLGNYYQRLDEIQSDLADRARFLIDRKKNFLEALQKQAGAQKPTARIDTMRKQLLTFDKRLTLFFKQLLLQKKQLFSSARLRHELLAALLRQIQQKKERLSRLSAHLKTSDPKNLLTKGYCILFAQNSDSAILSCQELIQGEEIRILLHDGQAAAKITEIKT